MSASKIIEQAELLIKAILDKDELKIEETLKQNGKNSSRICGEPIRKGMTPLHAATFCGYSNILKMILKTDINPNLQLSSTVRQGVYWYEIGSTPLHIAASRRHTDIVQILLDHKADPNIENEGEACQTALCIASEKGFLHSVKLLIEHEADINWQDKEGRTPLHLASVNGNSAITLLLITEGAHVNIQDFFGYTPLALASKEGKIKSAMILVENRANVDIPNLEGNSPLYHALLKEYVEIMAMLLIDNGADLNYQNKKGWTALHCAAIFGKQRAAEVLITDSADLNLKDNSGKTALHHAARSDLLNIVTILVDAGTDPTIKDNNGKTAMDYSSRKDIKTVLAKSEAKHLTESVPDDGEYGTVDEEDLIEVKGKIKELELKIDGLNLQEDTAAELCIRLRHLNKEVKKFKGKKELDVCKSRLSTVKIEAKVKDLTGQAKFRSYASAIFYSNALSKMMDSLKKDVVAVKIDIPQNADSDKVVEFTMLTEKLADSIAWLQRKASKSKAS